MHKEFFLAELDEDIFPTIMEGPFYKRLDVEDRFDELSNPKNYVILEGDFPDE